MAKAASWASTDAHARKRGEQTGLDTLVVHALNDVVSSCSDFVAAAFFSDSFQKVVIVFGRLVATVSLFNLSI